MCRCMIIATVCLLSLQVIATEKPTAFELLDKYAANQDKLKSFICKQEMSADRHALLTEAPYKALSGKSKTKESYEYRFDGSRYNTRLRKWGNVKSSRKFIPKDQAPYNSVLWDGNTYFSYRAGIRPGTVYIVTRKEDFSRKIWAQHKGWVRYGPGDVLRGVFHDERIDLILSKAQTISVRDKTETIGQSQCYAIDAVTKQAKYKVWIDPEHGNNIAKVQVQYGNPNVFFSLKIIRFERINNVWVPMEGIEERRQTHRNGDFQKSVRHIKVTEMILNPDHDTLGSFLPDDIRDGAWVVVEGIKGTNRVKGLKGTGYTWQNGQIVDVKGHKFDYELRQP